ncbi:7-cyano-7-deazaguanine synthase [Algisphaera agarilytica]|uniref:7-cyano-7-deazaguanine synthase n=1 Tax=Algisphaera agarilytica TaxID=1385975 RepID=A0A7X0H6D8_9BACT|nr:7-cyano-7-deazaguanine synthase [Algisphaera agarilytica]MBB6430151.1 7-cyano-7-deazaguanine synthase [Algisphaera agarilytica]
MASRRHIAILHSGGLRSLVATARVLNQPEPVRLTLIHVHDGRAAGPQRVEHLRQQADYYTLAQPQEIELPHLYEDPTHHQPDGRPEAPLATPQLLLAALATATEIGADELHWPAAVNGKMDATAKAQEQQLLIQQLAEAEAPAGVLGPAGPKLVTPLLSYTDLQVIELGTGLGVPWELAWSCVLDQETQCGGCPACQRRRAAFRAAGVIDPVFAPAGVR